MLVYFLGLFPIFVWLFPVFKQYRTKYFYFFLVPALAGPIMLMTSVVLKLFIPNMLYPAYYIFLLSAISEREKKYYLAAIAALLAIIFPIIHPSNLWLFGISLIVVIPVLVTFIRELTEIIMNKKQLNLFLMLIIIYLLIDLTKLVDVFVSINDGVLFYYMGVISQMFFGIAFCFVNIDTKNFNVHVKALDEN